MWTETLNKTQHSLIESKNLTTKFMNTNTSLGHQTTSNPGPQVPGGGRGADIHLRREDLRAVQQVQPPLSWYLTPPLQPGPLERGAAPGVWLPGSPCHLRLPGFPARLSRAGLGHRQVDMLPKHRLLPRPPGTGAGWTSAPHRPGTPWCSSASWCPRPV